MPAMNYIDIIAVFWRTSRTPRRFVWAYLSSFDEMFIIFNTSESLQCKIDGQSWKKYKSLQIGEVADEQSLCIKLHIRWKCVCFYSTFQHSPLRTGLGTSWRCNIEVRRVIFVSFHENRSKFLSNATAVRSKLPGNNSKCAGSIR